MRDFWFGACFGLVYRLTVGPLDSRFIIFAVALAILTEVFYPSHRGQTRGKA